MAGRDEAEEPHVPPPRSKTGNGSRGGNQELWGEAIIGIRAQSRGIVAGRDSRKLPTRELEPVGDRLRLARDCSSEPTKAGCTASSRCEECPGPSDDVDITIDAEAVLEG